MLRRLALGLGIALLASGIHADAETFLVRYVPTKKMVIALTFDDGPNWRFTPRYLDYLKSEDVRATFFLLGRNVEKYRELALRIKADGHEIGQHSYDHKHFDELTPQEVLEDLAHSQKIFYDTFGSFPEYFRPPYGVLRRDDYVILRNYFVHVVKWTIDDQDWKLAMSADGIAQRVLDRVKPGDIILCHDHSLPAFEALTKMVPALKAKGYKFVTVSELLYDN